MLKKSKKCTCGKEYTTKKELLECCDRFRVCSQGHLWVNCTCNSTLLITSELLDGIKELKLPKDKPVK